MNQWINGSMTKVSIVCVTYNRRDLLLQCLRSCVAQDYPALDILVLVNASEDGTEEAIKRECLQARVIRTHQNLGFFPALNIAIANTSGDYIMMMDDDAYFKSDDAITRMVEAFTIEPTLGAVTCNLEGPTETPIESDRYISVFTTGFTMVPRKVFTEWVGYFPDLFFRSAGETYICTTLWEMGKRVKRLADVRMHHERALHGRSDRDWKFYGLRSQILCAMMREPWYLLIPSLLSKAVKSLFQFIRWGHFTTWFSAWFSAFINLSEAFRLRRPISWRTRKLWWRLNNEAVSDVSVLPEYRRVVARLNVPERLESVENL
jgi:GT2 family glycosyltransferase